MPQDAHQGPDQVRELYFNEFVPLNAEFKQLVTIWQLNGPVPEELTRLGERLVGMLSRLGCAEPDWQAYALRFGTALDNVAAGDHRWLAGVLIDSCHTVWFELHARLLDRLGLAREQAEAGEGRS
ncbi:hypothetical protein ABT086_00215 [Streptomyces mirabilis]